MRHRGFRGKLLQFLEGDSPKEEMDAIGNHAAQCPVSSKELKLLASVWRSEAALERVKPSSDLWTRLEVRMKEDELNRRLAPGLGERLELQLRLAAVVMLLLLAIVFGNYLANVPPSNGIAESDKTAKEELAQVFYLDIFEPFPSESIGKALAMTAYENGK